MQSSTGESIGVFLSAVKDMALASMRTSMSRKRLDAISLEMMAKAQEFIDRSVSHEEYFDNRKEIPGLDWGFHRIGTTKTGQPVIVGYIIVAGRKV